MWPAAREGGGGCVTLGAMFAASRDTRPGGGPACREAARPAGAGPVAGQAGLRATLAGRGRGSGGAGIGLFRPGLAVGAGPARSGAEGRVGGSLPLRGTGSPLGRWGAWAGMAWRARSGGGASSGGVGGATAAPPQAKFEKRTRFPPFFKPKNKTFSRISLAPFLPPGPSPVPASQGGPCSARGRRCGVGGFYLPPCRRGRARGPLPERLAPRCGRAAAAPRVSRGAPQADTAPCWRALVSLRRVSRPAGLGSGTLPVRTGGGCGPLLPGPSLRLVRCPPRQGLARSGWSRALRPPPTHLLGALPSPSPLLKRATPGGRLRPGRASGVRAGLGWARGLGGLCPRTCSRAADPGRHSPAAAA